MEAEAPPGEAGCSERPCWKEETPAAASCTSPVLGHKKISQTHPKTCSQHFPGEKAVVVSLQAWGQQGVVPEHGFAFLSNLRFLAKHHLAAPPGCSPGCGFHKGLLGSLVFITLASTAACQLAEVSSSPGAGSHSTGCAPLSIPVCQGARHLPADGTWRWLGGGHDRTVRGRKGYGAKRVHRRYGARFLVETLGGVWLSLAVQGKCEPLQSRGRQAVSRKVKNFLLQVLLTRRISKTRAWLLHWILLGPFSSKFIKDGLFSCRLYNMVHSKCTTPSAQHGTHSKSCTKEKIRPPYASLWPTFRYSSRFDWESKLWRCSQQVPRRVLWP